MERYDKLFVFFALLIIGYFLKRAKYLKENDNEALIRIIFNITLPAVILYSFNGFRFSAEHLAIPIISLVYPLFVYVIIRYLLFPKFFNRENTLAKISLIGYNIGLFAYPIIEILIGTDALRYTVLFEIGNSLVIFVFLYMISYMTQLGKFSIRNVPIKKILTKLFTFPPFVCVILAFALAGLEINLPNGVVSVLKATSSANIILFSLVLGMTLDFDIKKEDLKFVMKILFLRYTYGIIGIIVFFLFLPISLMLKTILSICLLLPVPMATLPYSIEFGFDTKRASALVNISNIISLVLVFVLAIILKLI